MIELTGINVVLIFLAIMIPIVVAVLIFFPGYFITPNNNTNNTINSTIKNNVPFNATINITKDYPAITKQVEKMFNVTSANVIGITNKTLTLHNVIYNSSNYIVNLTTQPYDFIIQVPIWFSMSFPNSDIAILQSINNQNIQFAFDLTNGEIGYAYYTAHINVTSNYITYNFNLTNLNQYKVINSNNLTAKTVIPTTLVGFKLNNRAYEIMYE